MEIIYNLSLLWHRNFLLKVHFRFNNKQRLSRTRFLVLFHWCIFFYRITTDVGKTFCPHCGNKTLSKVSVSVNEDGTMKYFLSRHRPVNIRGTKVDNRGCLFFIDFGMYLNKKWYSFLFSWLHGGSESVKITSLLRWDIFNNKLIFCIVYARG